MAKNRKKKQYMLFALGYWDNINDIIKEIVEVLSPVTADFGTMRYIHSDTSLICIFQSEEEFKSMSEYVMEELDQIIDVCILLPKPSKFSSRMDESLENHLLAKTNLDLDKLLVDDLDDLQDIKDIIGKNAKQNKPKLRIKTNTHIVLDLDVILDKISEKGMDSLTDSELKFLKNQSKT
jgi:hypothetical protein